MNIWRTVNREARSAWRSMRYELNRPARGGAHAGTAAGKHTTPAGNHTTPAGNRSATADSDSATEGQTAQLPSVDTGAHHPAYDAYARRTHRVRTALVVATLAVGGAAATYLGVVSGLTALLAGENPPPGALPAVSITDQVGESQTGLDTGAKAVRPAAGSASLRPAGAATPAESATPGDDREESRPARTPAPPRRSPDREPPVPTPAPHPTPTCTDPPAPTPSPSPTPTHKPSPEPSPPAMPPQ